MIKLSELELYNKLKEELTQEYNKALNGEILNASKLMYEYRIIELLKEKIHYTEDFGNE